MSVLFNGPRLKKIYCLFFGFLFLAALSHAETKPPVSEEGKKPQALLPLQELRIFTTVFDHIKKLYVEEVDDKTLLENAVKGMLQGLDPHSTYLDEDKFNDLQESTTGEFAGLGIEVGVDDGFVRVISPIDDTPAQRAGIQSGDVITRIDQQSVKGLSLDDAVEKMRGIKGTSVVLTIYREGLDQPFDVTIVRDIIKVKSVKSRELTSGFLYVRVAQFQQHTGDELNTALQQYMVNKSIKGLILDLRNNPGGLLQAAVSVSDTFLEEGLIVYTKGRGDSGGLRYSATEGDILSGAPIVVLINSGSASASEIVAGALQDHHRALLVGTRSFGKGSVQTVIPVSEKQAIKLTTSRYYTPSDRSIQAEGIEPDIRVESAQIQLQQSEEQAYSEAALQGHLENQTKHPAGKPVEKSGFENSVNIEQDNQLYEAFNILKAVSLMTGQRTDVVEKQ